MLDRHNTHGFSLPYTGFYVLVVMRMPEFLGHVTLELMTAIDAAVQVRRSRGERGP